MEYAQFFLFENSELEVRISVPAWTKDQAENIINLIVINPPDWRHIETREIPRNNPIKIKQV
jgi:hypothetical protein